MILHGVFLQLAPDGDRSELATVMQSLERLCSELSGCSGFKHGPNRDFEHKSPDYPYGFIATFDTPEALATYANNPDHKALGARLVALCVGGGDGIMVYDLEMESR